MNIFINLSVIFWSLFPALMSYTQPASTPLKVELRQLLSNCDFSNGTNGWLSESVDSFNVVNGQAIIVASVANTGIYQQNLVITGHTYYYSMKLTNTERCYFETSLPYSNSRIDVGTNQVFSKIHTHTDTGFANTYIRNYYGLPNTITIDYVVKYDITDLVSLGLLPSGLTDNEYKTLIDNILPEIGGTFQGSYFYTETIADNYKWFSTGFVEKTGERDFIDYLGFFVWLVVPYLFAFVVYKLLKGVIYG